MFFVGRFLVFTFFIYWHCCTKFYDCFIWYKRNLKYQNLKLFFIQNNDLSLCLVNSQCSLICFIGLKKRHFIIDQQIAWHFVHYSECLYHLPSLLSTQITTPFLTSRFSTRHYKGLGLIFILLNGPLVISSKR